MSDASISMAINDAAVAVNGLSVVTPNGRRIVEDVSFEIAAGEILGVVGESGSGKTTLGLALLNYCRRGLDVSAGVVRISGRALPPPGKGQDVRRRLACYVPQDPATALNPALRIRTQLEECLARDGAVAHVPLQELMTEVMLPTQPEFLDAFPHQLSGGQLQRVAIAMAFANRPRLVVMDEPTTGLDVTTQAHVLKTVTRLSEHYKVATVYVSHDIAVVSSIAHRTAVVYAGRIVEIGPTERVLGDPAHPYTRALIRAVPDLGSDFAVSGIAGQASDTGADLRRCSFAPRCELATDICRRSAPDLSTVERDHHVRCVRAAFREHNVPRPLPAHDHVQPETPLLSTNDLTAFHGRAKILHGLSFEVRQGECIGVVGTSGSGKTTLARALAGLHGETGGEMFYKRNSLAAGSQHRNPDARRNIQYIFQNPYGSLNPRRSVGASIAMALSQFSREPATEMRRKVLRVLDQVSLPASAAERYPGQLSGGQRQRVAIARALIVEPEVLICDEITSALDVSVQARIMELLADLQRERGLTILFVSHNLAVVRNIAQRILVMQQGRIAESGRTDEILRSPQSDVTKRLLEDAPRFLQSSQSPSHEASHAI